MAQRDLLHPDPYRSGQGFRTDPAPEGISFRDSPIRWDEEGEEAPPRQWVPSRPVRKLPVAHSGSGGGSLTQKHTSAFLEGEVIPVTSSMGMVSARWDPDGEELEILFNSGKGKAYAGVPWYTAQDFITAGSKGTWMWNNVLVRGKGNKGKTKKPSRDITGHARS